MTTAQAAPKTTTEFTVCLKSRNSHETKELETTEPISMIELDVFQQEIGDTHASIKDSMFGNRHVYIDEVVKAIKLVDYMPYIIGDLEELHVLLATFGSERAAHAADLASQTKRRILEKMR